MVGSLHVFCARALLPAVFPQYRIGDARRGTQIHGITVFVHRLGDMVGFSLNVAVLVSTNCCRVAPASLRAPAAPLRCTPCRAAEDDSAAPAATAVADAPSDKIAISDLVDGQIYEGTVVSHSCRMLRVSEPVLRCPFRTQTFTAL